MANRFREVKPKRTCTKKYKNYRDYKKYLREDFNMKCGYTDCVDSWFGGKSSFHIDHFKPASKYPKLETDYSNLVYCCSYVNIQKSDIEGDYLDPCDVEYNDHFERDLVGNIMPKKASKEAKFMYMNLKLYLRRYQIIWLLEKIGEKKKNLYDNIINASINKKLKQEMQETYIELDRCYMDYVEYLKNDL